MSLFDELKRRNVLRAAVFYLAAAWLLAQVATQILPVFDAPAWLLRWVIVALAVGFPFWLALAWFYELTPEGLKREGTIDPAQSITAHTGKRLDRWIIGILAVAVVLLLTDTFVRHRGGGSNADADRGSIAEHSIAVLPFLDMSAGKDQEFMSDGLAEELINLLVRIPALHVTSRSSAFAFKGQALGSPEIARRLRVAHILEGSIRKSGDQLRIDAQLIDARSDTNLWSQTFQRPLDDIFAVQDEIAAAVVAQLKVTLLQAVPKTDVIDTRAYALFLQARPLSRRHTAEGYEQSNALYQQALAIDAGYAPAWDGLAYNYRRQANNALRPLEEGYRLAREALQKALAIDPNYAPSIAALGRIALDHDGDLAAAARYLERALALAPTDPDIIYTAARVAEGLGRLDVSMPLDEYALRHDPLNPTLQNIVGIDYRYAGRFDDSVAAFRTVLSISPDNVSVHYRMAETLLEKGDYAAALAIIEKEPSEAWRSLGMPMAYHGLGDPAKYAAAVDTMIATVGQKWPIAVANTFAFCGEVDRAFEWLDKGAAAHDPNLAPISVESLVTRLHADPRWPAFLRKIGRAPEQLAEIRFDVALPRAGGAAPERAAN